MGYTHRFSFRKTPSNTRWTAFIEEVRRLLVHPAFADQLCWEYDQPERPPQIDETVVRFNGRGKMGCETFYLANPFGGETGDFCKTNFDVERSFRVYDIAACAVLVAAHRHAGANVHSDGAWYEPGWLLARAVYFEVTSVAPTCPWSPKESEVAAVGDESLAEIARDGSLGLAALRKLRRKSALLKRGWAVVAIAPIVPTSAMGGR